MFSYCSNSNAHAHAHQARIRTWDWASPTTSRFAGDIVAFAVSAKLYPPSSKKEDFSFSDVFDPVTFGGARFCEARVFSFFSTVAEGGSAAFTDE